VRALKLSQLVDPRRHAVWLGWAAVWLGATDIYETRAPAARSADDGEPHRFPSRPALGQLSRTLTSHAWMSVAGVQQQQQQQQDQLARVQELTGSLKEWQAQHSQKLAEQRDDMASIRRALHDDSVEQRQEFKLMQTELQRQLEALVSCNLSSTAHILSSRTRDELATNAHDERTRTRDFRSAPPLPAEPFPEPRILSTSR
jgi:hypothetical protein